MDKDTKTGTLANHADLSTRPRTTVTITVATEDDPSEFPARVRRFTSDDTIASNRDGDIVDLLARAAGLAMRHFESEPNPFADWAAETALRTALRIKGER